MSRAAVFQPFTRHDAPPPAGRFSFLLLFRNWFAVPKFDPRLVKVVCGDECRLVVGLALVVAFNVCIAIKGIGERHNCGDQVLEFGKGWLDLVSQRLQFGEKALCLMDHRKKLRALVIARHAPANC